MGRNREFRCLFCMSTFIKQSISHYNCPQLPFRIHPKMSIVDAWNYKYQSPHALCFSYPCTHEKVCSVITLSALRLCILELLSKIRIASTKVTKTGTIFQTLREQQNDQQVCHIYIMGSVHIGTLHVLGGTDGVQQGFITRLTRTHNLKLIHFPICHF